MNKDLIKKSGFTLPEILITLGVIGVVAAITMPIIHSKIQWTILKNRYKKVYNTYSQAIQLVQNDDYLYLCYSDDNGQVAADECNLFFNELMKKFKVIKECKNNALLQGCVPVYYSYNTSSGCNGYNENYINNHNKVVVMQDGSILIRYPFQTPLFAVDINGFKGPNKAGYDLFLFDIGKNNGLYINPLTGGCQWLAPGGKYGKEMLLN